MQTHWAHPGYKQITYGGGRCLVLSKTMDIQIMKSFSATRHSYPFPSKGCLTSRAASVRDTETYMHIAHALEPGRSGSTSRQLITSTTNPDQALPFFHYPQITDNENIILQTECLEDHIYIAQHPITGNRYPRSHIKLQFMRKLRWITKKHHENISSSLPFCHNNSIDIQVETTWCSGRQHCTQHCCSQTIS